MFHPSRVSSAAHGTTLWTDVLLFRSANSVAAGHGMLERKPESQQPMRGHRCKAAESCVQAGIFRIAGNLYSAASSTLR